MGKNLHYVNSANSNPQSEAPLTFNMFFTMIGLSISLWERLHVNDTLFPSSMESVDEMSTVKFTER